ncbi:MAG: hypothetical protein ACWGPR_08435 [Candidatus Deferrimicrobiaceae bacterium]
MSELCLGQWPDRLVGDAREPFIAFAPYDMTGETVTITVEDTATGVDKVTAGSCLLNVISTTQSQITWQATAAQLDTAGLYRVWFDSTEAGQEPRRLGYIKLRLFA